MELIHCRNKSCWLQVSRRGRGHSQKPTLQRSWGKEKLWSLKQALKNHCSQNDTCIWDRNWCSSQPILSRDHSSQLPTPLSPTPLPRLCSGENPSSATHQVWWSLQPTLPLTAGQSYNTNTPCNSSSKQGAANRDSYMPCLQLFKKKLYLFISRNTSEYTHPFLNKVSLQGNTQVQKHTTTSKLPSSGASKWKR